MRGKSALGGAPCRTRALFGQGLEVDFHQALNRQDVGAHGAAQRFLGNTLIGAVHRGIRHADLRGRSSQRTGIRARRCRRRW